MPVSLFSKEGKVQILSSLCCRCDASNGIYQVRLFDNIEGSSAVD